MTVKGGTEIYAHGGDASLTPTNRPHNALDEHVRFERRKKAIRRRNGFVAGLEKLQDALGDLNDIAVQWRWRCAVEAGRTRAEPLTLFTNFSNLRCLAVSGSGARRTNLSGKSARFNPTAADLHSPQRAPTGAMVSACLGALWSTTP